MSEPHITPCLPESLLTLSNDRQIDQLLRCETITEEEVKRLCIKAREILIEEANVQVVDSPVTVRVHGDLRPSKVHLSLRMYLSDMR